MIHVIEIRNGVVFQMDTFLDTEEEKKKAEELFVTRAKQAGASIDDDDIEGYLNDGFIEYNLISGSVCLHHSNLTI